MGRNLRLLLNAALTILGSLLAATGPAYAYPTPVDFDGSLSRWSISKGDAPITYDIDAGSSDVADIYRPAVDEAAQMWSSIPGSYFQYAPAPAGQGGQVTLHLQSSLSGVRETAGYTVFDKYNGDKPVHCSIYIQVTEDISYYVLSKVFLHEMGHGVGLGHSLVPQAIMSYSLEKNSFALDLDDNAAVAHLYPADGEHPHVPLGCAAGAAPRNGSSRLALWLFLLLPVCCPWPLWRRGGGC